MKTFIALLRGINVGGHKKIKMAELRKMFEALDCKGVETYIQSGNVVFKIAKGNVSSLEKIIKKGILDYFGIDVPVLVKTKIELKKIVEDNPYEEGEGAGSTYFVLLHTPPEKSMVDSLRQLSFENETFVITPLCVYLNCKKGYGNAKCNNNFFETKLKVSATTRNFKTMERLMVLAETRSDFTN